MIDEKLISLPSALLELETATMASGFTMASDRATGSLLRTLAASKPGGRLLELGTGTGLGCSWILDGMDSEASLLSVEMEAAFLGIARARLGSDKRLRLIEADAAIWLEENAAEDFDFIFADTWAGKYFLLNEAIALLKPGGLYIIDDMLPQPSWPDGHYQKAIGLISELLNRTDLLISSLHWSTGIIIGCKK
jgi:predicted O-methyltransferase YrrM